MSDSSASLQLDAQLDQQRTLEVLQARARALARPAARESLEKSIALLVFKLGEQRYSVPLERIFEILTAGAITPIPGTPPFIKGVINVRGQIFTLVDLAAYFSVASEAADSERSVLIVGDSSGLMGFLVDDVVGIAHHHPTEIHNLKLNLPGVKGDYISGSTADAVAVLNLDELLSDRKMIVEDE